MQSINNSYICTICMCVYIYILYLSPSLPFSLSPSFSLPVLQMLLLRNTRVAHAQSQGLGIFDGGHHCLLDHRAPGFIVMSQPANTPKII